MKRVTYMVVVDDDVKFPPEEFERDVMIYLADPDGWTSKGYDFVLVKRNPHVTIHLTSRAGLRKRGCDDTLSCAILDGNQMWVNEDRWKRGAKVSGQDLNGYRQYVISHEMGHILGRDHVKCPGSGRLAPIMLQQTLGLHGCLPNTNV
jgi:hypothetical protein